MPAERFTGRVAVVTGGGGQIGRAIAHRLAGEGATVLVVDHDATAAAATADAVGAAGGIAYAMAADVTSPDDTERFVRAAVELGGGELHALVANAGVEGAVRPIEELSVEDLDHVLAVNVRGVFLGIRHALPHMTQGAAIVAMGSVASLLGAPGAVPYVASKHAVLGITRTVALEVARRGIRVNAVLPGAVEGRMIGSIAAQTGRAGALEAFAGAVPLRRFGLPEEVAAVVAFLLSDEAAYVTGAAWPVDGGRLA